MKLVIFGLPGTAQFFASIGLPGFLAYVVFAAEAMGGIAVRSAKMGDTTSRPDRSQFRR